VDIGFSGTQRGMTEAQKATVSRLLAAAPGVTSAHHGDCIGADAQFHELALAYAPVIIHPPTNDAKRAFCHGAVVLPAEGYIARNHAIVDACQVVIATPKEADEVVRSGTWATIRYARQQGKLVLVIRPDGSRI
jgi:hypothetical protein